MIWVFSPLLRLRHQASRLERIAKAEERLDALAKHHRGPRPKRKDHHEIRASIDKILDGLGAKSYFNVSVDKIFKHTYRQDHPGRPGPNTRFIRKTRTHWNILWKLDEEKIAYDHRSDGMYPLITNDRDLPAEDVFKAHKRQPRIERRFETLKTVHEIAPVLLKNEGRIEALFFLHFIALLVQALIERELRRAMEREGIAELPIYPEERPNRRPTAEQIFRLFSHLQRTTLMRDGEVLKAFAPELTDIQKQVLSLLGVRSNVYSSAR